MALTTMSLSNEAQPFFGFVETTGDALRLIQAARLGLIPRVNRRLNDTERRSMVRSGAVFIFSVEESGIRRWTEGLLWSASRIVGNFLVYREVTERGSGRASYGKSYAQGTPSSRRLSHLPPDQQSRIRFEKSLVGSLLDHHGRFKEEGLIKKTITVSVAGRDHHLVSYYKMEDIESGLLTRPVSFPQLRDIEIPSDMLESTTFRYPPKVETGSDGRLRYIRDADESELSQRASPQRRRFSSDTPLSPTATRRSFGAASRARPELSISPPSSQLPPSSWAVSPDSYHQQSPVTQERTHQSFRATADSYVYHQSPVREYPSAADSPEQWGKPVTGGSEAIHHASSSTYTFPVMDNQTFHTHSSSRITTTTYQHQFAPTSLAASGSADIPSGWSASTWPYSHSAELHGRWNSDPQLYAMNSMNNLPESTATESAPPLSSSPHESQYSAPTPPDLSISQETQQPYLSSPSDSATAAQLPFTEQQQQEPYGRVIPSSYQMPYYPHSSGA